MNSKMPPESHLPSSCLEVGKPRVTFTHIQRRPGLVENEIQAEMLLNPHWLAIYRLEPKSGEHDITEIRLLPRPGEPPDTRPAPPGLGTERVLRALQDTLEQVAENGGGEFVEQVLERFGLERRLVEDTVPRRRRRPDVDVARAAAAYASAPRRGRRRAVAAAIGCSLSNADKLIRAARDRSFLDGAELTDRARQVLAASDSWPR